MIGNDVVDIIKSRKESNWQRKGFLNKIFTPEEQQFIAIYPDPEIMVWILWSMKEAAYKIYNRQTAIRSFNPKQLVCSINNKHYGTVMCYNLIFYTTTSVKDNCIYTVASTSKKNLKNVYEIYDPLIFKDDNGLPYVLNNKGKIQPVSVSHHGKYYKIAALIIG